MPKYQMSSGPYGPILVAIFLQEENVCTDLKAKVKQIIIILYSQISIPNNCVFHSRKLHSTQSQIALVRENFYIPEL